MAELTVAGDTVTLELTRAEHWEGFRGDIDAPLASVTAVRVSDDPWKELRGLRAPGTGIPGVVAVGTRRGSFGRDFAAVHGRGPGVVVEFDGQPFQRWVLSTTDPGTVVARVSSAAGLA
ncbi:MAG: hypothetical protein ABSF84_00965 [Acidimicrobiales bacterium]|jgi:hypothetical protein